MSFVPRHSWRTPAVVFTVGMAMLFASLHGAAPAQAVSPDIVISQVYGGGGNTGATLTNDFVELFNRGSAPVSLVGWSVQHTTSAGTTWEVTQVSGLVQPGQYYLVQQAAGAGGTTALPAPDAVGTIGVGGTSGKLAVVNSTTALVGSCPLGGGVVDFVGYGGADCFEGTGSAPTLSNAVAAIRASGGCTDTDESSTDFTSGAPNPRNSASPLNPCAVAITPTPTPTPTTVTSATATPTPTPTPTTATTPTATPIPTTATVQTATATPTPTTATSQTATATPTATTAASTTATASPTPTAATIPNATATTLPDTTPTRVAVPAGGTGAESDAGPGSGAATTATQPVTPGTSAASGSAAPPGATSLAITGTSTLGLLLMAAGLIGLGLGTRRAALGRQ